MAACPWLMVRRDGVDGWIRYPMMGPKVCSIDGRPSTPRRVRPPCRAHMYLIIVDQDPINLMPIVGKRVRIRSRSGLPSRCVHPSPRALVIGLPAVDRRSITMRALAIAIDSFDAIPIMRQSTILPPTQSTHIRIHSSGSSRCRAFKCAACCASSRSATHHSSMADDATTSAASASDSAADPCTSTQEQRQQQQEGGSSETNPPASTSATTAITAVSGPLSPTAARSARAVPFLTGNPHTAHQRAVRPRVHAATCVLHSDRTHGAARHTTQQGTLLLHEAVDLRPVLYSDDEGEEGEGGEPGREGEYYGAGLGGGVDGTCVVCSDVAVGGPSS